MTGCSRRTVLAALIGAAIPPGLAAAPAGDGALRFGLTPVLPEDRIGFLQRWADWLGARLGRPLVFVQRSRYREILDLLLNGQLDLAWICGYPYARHRDRLSLLAIPRFRGCPCYQSYIIVCSSSGIARLRDLEGALFAWADPDSNSGYLYPRFRLAGAGLDPERFFRRTFFTWGHPRGIEAVAVGLADGAAVDGYVWETLGIREPALTAGTRILERSPDFAFPPIVAGPALPAAERERVRQILLAQERDAEGRALLGELELDGFDDGTPDLYDPIARMAETAGVVGGYGRGEP